MGEEPKHLKWLWFRTEPGARRSAREEFEKLPTAGRAGLAVVIERFRTGTSRRKDVDSLGSGLYELRYRFGNNHFRVIFTWWGPHCVGLTVFFKNQQKTSKTDLDRARNRAARWRAAFGDEPDPNGV